MVSEFGVAKIKAQHQESIICLICHYFFTVYLLFKCRFVA